MNEEQMKTAKQRAEELRMALVQVKLIRFKYPDLVSAITKNHHDALLRYYDAVRTPI